MAGNSYLLFDASRDGFDDGEGNLVSLGEHLEYLDNWGGTPDCFDSIEASNCKAASAKAKEMGRHLYVVNESLYRVVGEVKG